MEKNEFIQKLEDILEEHCVPSSLFSINQIYANYEKIMAECDQKPWALFGGGGTFTHFAQDFLQEKPYKNLCCILDNDSGIEGTRLNDIPVYKPEALTQLGIESVCLIVPGHIKEITEQLKGISSEITIHNMSDFPSYYMKNMYASIHMDRVKYYEATDPQVKKQQLEIIIASYLDIGDFSNGFDYLEKHIKEYEDPSYVILKEKLQRLLGELKRKLAERTEIDSTLIILDNLLKNDAYQQMPFLNQWKEQGTCYEKAYSPGVYTIEATHAIFQQQYGPENLKNNFTKTAKDTKLYEHFMKEGYENNVYHTIGVTGQMVSDVNQIIYNDTSVYKNCVFQRSTPLLFWEMITNLGSSPEKQFNLVHTIQESHLPYLGGKHSVDLPILEVYGMTNKEEQETLFQIRCKEALLYLDQQLSFYLPLLPEISTKVITADHGRFKKLNPNKEDTPKLFFWHRSHYHVPLIVVGKTVESKKIEDVFSLFHLPDMLISLEKEKTLFQQESSYARVDFRGWVSESRRKNDIKNGLSGHIDGFICFLDDTYKLVLDGHGVFHYFAMDKEEEELFDPSLQKEIDRRFRSFF